MSERKRIYLCLAHMSEAGLEQKYIKEAFDTNWVVPLGPNVDAFEHELEGFVNGNDNEKLSKRVVVLSSGTAAVHLALLNCGVGPGDEVIAQSFTFCASAHPVTYLGAGNACICRFGERYLEHGYGADGRGYQGPYCQDGKEAEGYRACSIVWNALQD